MADDSERAAIVAEIAELQKQHSEAHIKAIYVGWTREEEAARQNRDGRIALLHRQLAGLDRTSRRLIASDTD
jgi:hypothetical protein